MMYPIQRSAYSVCLYTTTTIQYILYNVIIQLWGVITMVNLFLVYFPALLLYTTTIQYIHTYILWGIGNSKLSKVLRETNHRAIQRYYYILLVLYSIYYIIRTPALKGGSISYILLLYTIQYKRGRISLLGGQIFFEKSLEIWIFCCIFMGGGLYKKSVQ